MKVKLIINENQKIVNYQNVYINDLDQLYDNGCFEIYCDYNILKVVPPDQIANFILVLCKKLRHSGELIITGIDIDLVTKKYLRKDLDINVLSELLGGSVGFYNCKIIEEMVRQNNLEITEMSIEDNFFIVKGKRG